MNEKTKQLLRQANSDENSSISFAERFFSSREEADAAFAVYTSKIPDLAAWNSSSLLTSFAAFDESGNEIEDAIIRWEIFLRLSLKGSGKFDWVRVVEIFETENETVVTVKPTFDPTDKNADRAATSHFFSAASSNNFCLLKEDKTISFYVIGLEERQNTNETKNALETLRNVVTANAGYYMGIQKSEWTKFCKDFLDLYRSDNRD